MLKRLAIIGLLVIMVGVFGCASTTSIPTYVASPTPKPEPKPIPIVPTSQVVEVPGVEARLVNVSWISPAEVEVKNYYSGARAEYIIKIHNGGDGMSKFSVSYRVPDNPKEGYDMPLKEAQNWVIISDTSPLLSAKETKEILVALVVPEGVKLDSNKWEFWISMVEGGQGLVQTEMAQRWLISMR